MDVKRQFTNDFDEMADEILAQLSIKKQYAAREIIFEFIKKYPDHFEVNEEEFKKRQEELLISINGKDLKSEANREAVVFKHLKDSIVSERSQRLSFNVDALTSFNSFKATVKGLQLNMKISVKDTIVYVLDIATVIELSKIKMRRRYADLLKECGYSQSYGSFMLRFLNLSRTYPDLRLISTPIQYIKNNMGIIEKNIHKHFLPQQCPNI